MLLTCSLDAVSIPSLPTPSATLQEKSTTSYIQGSQSHLPALDQTTAEDENTTDDPNDEQAVFQDPSIMYGSRLLAQLQEMREADQLTDAFIVGRGGANCMVSVHKVMLAATSTYTRGHLDRSLCSNTFIFSCQKEILVALTMFMYTGVIDLDETLLSFSDKVIQAFHVEEFNRIVGIFRKLVAIKEMSPGLEPAWETILADEQKLLGGEILLLQADPLQCRFDVHLQRIKNALFGMKYIYSQMLYCDVKVYGVEACRTFSAHRPMIAAVVPNSVRNIFIKSRNIDAVCFVNLKDQVIETLLKFMYSGELSMSGSANNDLDIGEKIVKVYMYRA